MIPWFSPQNQANVIKQSFMNWYVTHCPCSIIINILHIEVHFVENLKTEKIMFNHFSTTGRTMTFQYGRPLKQAAWAAFVTSSFKILLTQTFPRCGATCYILPSRAMTQLFNGVNFVYRSVEVYLTFCSYLRVLVRIQNFYNGGRY